MTLSLMPAGAGKEGGWRFAGSALLVVLALGLASGPGRAQEGDAFSATVAVDATADTVAQARDMARADGQRRALAAVAERLSAGNTRVKLPKLDDKAITDLVLSFEVANERMSAVRYAADYTVHFRPEEIRRVLGISGPGVPGPGTPGPGNPAPVASGDSGKPLVVIPVYQAAGQVRLWDDPNPWLQAWEQQPAGTGAARLVVPLGDAGDIAALDADKARAGDGEGLAAIARRNGGEEALVALAAPRGPPDRPAGVDVTVRRYRADRLVDSHQEKLTANPGESQSELLRRAAAAIVSDIASGWKNEAVAHDDQEGSLTAILPITDLDDWLRARERLAKVPAIRKIALMALSREAATIEIGYGGSIDQLKASLAEISLDLVRGDPLWRLARTGPARRP
jgi:uncharacterized protein DUF2066